MDQSTEMTVVEHWFERKTIGDGITLLWEPHVHPLLRCNIWHVRGRDQDILIDTGMGVGQLSNAARDLFDSNVLAVLTHTHMDHMGSAHEFKNCCVHAAEAEAMASAANHLPLSLDAYGEDEKAWFTSIGYDISGGLLTAIPFEGFDAETHHMEAAEATRIIGEGDIVDTGDRSFEVIHLPGHSPGSIALWEAKTGTLFSGDAIYDGPLLDQIPGSDIPTYIKTMERLRKLPVQVVHAGHEPSFGRERLVELVDDYLLQKEIA
jgi:glyoxylase-like metal-dependent hydrolase (beta-lactamase superfamily II)